ncbi:MAG: helix-turn-helix transcriptional regulator [Chloroflexi bacterium]|nr:helix-turn-helix transcriptional regulator [Chloroflexota bacterium]MYD16555.1 helix-turn-helix transcriptional regulator [Chloroflexota bacterium]MYE68351.1 helix-turn-helix transcriptional regulator [Acidimicrobiia bacterium]MYJ02404.1 helix-turn-helix transcriptional regulator [Chloroflexota bacterium]MYJ57803.1 helix-turn-helix transcriptional regulator [Chloroflexota bacterium]
MSSRGRGRRPQFAPGEAQLPGDFGERLTRLKRRAGLTWEEMAEALGVEDRQLLRWRRGSCPSGGSMLSLIRLAAQLPGGLNELMGHDPCAASQEERRR